MSFEFCCCLCSSVIKFLLFSCFFLFSIVDSLPEGSHCSFEEGPCGWTLNETAASPWSIRGFTDMTQDDSFVGSTLQTTGGRFLIVFSYSACVCVCIYTIPLTLVFLNCFKIFAIIGKWTLALVLSKMTLNVAKGNFWTWFKTLYETSSATKLTQLLETRVLLHVKKNIEWILFSLCILLPSFFFLWAMQLQSTSAATYLLHHKVKIAKQN